MKITAVGGYNAVGRNMTGVSVGKETVALDDGIRLDMLQMYDKEIEALGNKTNADLIRLDVIPDASLLSNVKAQVISHGHLDHVGALPFTKPNAPIVSTAYTNEIGKREYKGGRFHSVGYGDEYRIRPGLSVEFVEVTHSIPYSSIVVLHTPEGDVVYASDFRFDDSSQIARTDYKRLKELGKGRVKALIVESLRSTVCEKTTPESVVREKLSDTVSSIDSGLIIATTFSTHIERVQAILDVAEKAGRKTLILGRSLIKNIELARRFGLIDVPSGAKMLATPGAITSGLQEIRKRDEYFVLATGHQGEPDSVMSRIIDGTLPFKVRKDDSVLFCADVIPSPVNRATRYVMETKLRGFGANIFTGLHVSGHAAREDHRRLLKMLNPEHIIPCHGDLELRAGYASLAAEEGYELGRHIHLLMNGASIGI